MSSEWKTLLGAALLRSVYGLLAWTWRVVKWDMPAAEAPFLYAHWHGDELALIGPFSKEKLAVLVSRSRDGEMLNRWLSGIGFSVVRGSSSRGAVEGLRGLVSKVRGDRQSASLAVDGPRGPRGVVKGGILKLSQVTGRPIVPGVAVCRHAWLFAKTWNQAFLPWPYSTIYVQFGEPLQVPAECSENELEALRVELETTLHALKYKAVSKLTAQKSITTKHPASIGESLPLESMK